MHSIRKIINFVVLIGCLGFIFLGFYIYLFRKAPLQLLVLIILFFGMGLVVSIVSLMSIRESWAIDIKKLPKNQVIIMGICGMIFSLCALWIALIFRLHIIIKLMLFVSVIIIGKWSVDLLLNPTKKP